MERTENKMKVSEDKIFQFIVAYIKENQRSPTHKEIAKAMKCSTSTLHPRLNNLQMVGKIEITPRARRGIRVPGYQFVENTHNCTEVVGLSAQERKDLTTLASDFRLLKREDAREIIDTCKSYSEGQQKIMRVYENVYMTNK